MGLGRVWVWVFFKKNPKRVRVLIKTRRVPDLTRPDPVIYLSTKISSYIYLVINPTISYHFTFPAALLYHSHSLTLLSSNHHSHNQASLSHSLSSLLTTTTLTKPRNLYIGDASATSSDGHFVLNISFTL